MLPRLSFVAALLLAPLAASAQQAGGEASSDRAISAGDEALKLFELGRYAEAHGRFAEAESFYHSPVFVLYMARCKRALGELLEARALYERVARERVPDDAPEPWRRAVGEARAENEALAIPTLRIVVEGGPAEVELDGRVVDASGPLQLNPGEHRVRASRPGAPPREQIVRLEPGERRELRLVLPSPDTPAPLPPPPPRVPPTADEQGSMAPGLVLFGVAGAFGIAGAVTGGLALSRAGEVEELCEGTRCYPEAEGLRDEAVAFAHASTATLAVAGAALAAGVVLIVVRPGGGARVDAAVQPASVSVRVAF